MSLFSKPGHRVEGVPGTLEGPLLVGAHGACMSAPPTQTHGSVCTAAGKQRCVSDGDTHSPGR